MSGRLNLMNRIIMRATPVLRVAFALVLLGATSGAQAHWASDSYLTLRIENHKMNGQWDIALRDLQQVLNLDGDGDGNITWGELKWKREEVANFATSHLHLRMGGVAKAVDVTDLLVERFSDGAYA